MKSIRFLASALALALLLCACNKGGSELAGKWNISLSPELAEASKKMGVSVNGFDAYMEIKADNTWGMHGKIGPTDLGTEGGTWKLDGKKITFTFTQIQGKAPTGINTQPQTVQLSEDGKSFDFMMMKFTKE